MPRLFSRSLEKPTASGRRLLISYTVASVLIIEQSDAFTRHANGNPRKEKYKKKKTCNKGTPTPLALETGFGEARIQRGAREGPLPCSGLFLDTVINETNDESDVPAADFPGGPPDLTALRDRGGGSHFQLSSREATRRPRRSGGGGGRAACAERGNVIGTKTKRDTGPSRGPGRRTRLLQRGARFATARIVPREQKGFAAGSGPRLTTERYGVELKKNLQYGCLAKVWSGTTISVHTRTHARARAHKE